MVNPRLEMQRLAGKFAFFFAGVYLLVLFGLVVSTASGDPIPLLGWPLILIPAGAFVPSCLAAVKLHRTTDGAALTDLWRRSLLYAAIGVVLMVAAVLIIERITSV